MSNDEAKFVLNAYRPSGRDADDVAFAPALAQAKADPALGAWFARERTHATVVSTKLREIAPPAGLREAILAGGSATERAAHRGHRWGLMQWCGLAASIAIVVSLGAILWPKPAASASELTAFALNDVVHGRHGGHGEPQKELQTELSAASTHVASDLPVDFATLEKSGCRTLKIGGHDVLEVCFVRNGAEFHCYIGKAADFSSDSGAMTYVQRAGLAAAAWTHDAYRFVVVSDAGLDAVKRLL